MPDSFEVFQSIPSRLLLDTCVLNRLYEEGEYIFEGQIADHLSEDGINAELSALRSIFQVNQRAAFQFLISPLSVAEVANIQDFGDRERRLRWVLDVLDHWLIMLDDSDGRAKAGGTVQHRFKLSHEMQELEARLMEIPDFRRDPFDRLLLIQYRLGHCDAFITTDEDTIWRHRDKLSAEGVQILRPAEFWEILKPWANLWF